MQSVHGLPQYFVNAVIEGKEYSLLRILVSAKSHDIKYDFWPIGKLSKVINNKALEKPHQPKGKQ
ncbi:MAG: hypothetical protein ACI88A_001584 [Paraglaciecola sp.]|jgi:hypothetical protein